MLGLVFGFGFGLVFMLMFRLVFGLVFRLVFGLVSRLGLELVFPCPNWLELWYDLRLSRLGLLSELPSKIMGRDLLSISLCCF